jgi:hypothetical protein
MNNLSPAIPKLFASNGPRQILVGDNPDGRETIVYPT